MNRASMPVLRRLLVAAVALSVAGSMTGCTLQINVPDRSSQPLEETPSATTGTGGSPAESAAALSVAEYRDELQARGFVDAPASTSGAVAPVLYREAQPSSPAYDLCEGRCLVFELAVLEECPHPVVSAQVLDARGDVIPPYFHKGPYDAEVGELASVRFDKIPDNAAFKITGIECQ